MHCWFSRSVVLSLLAPSVVRWLLDCYCALQKLRLKFKNVPAPVETHVTRWASDPWARGAYSYYAVGNPLSITGVTRKVQSRPFNPASVLKTAVVWLPTVAA